MNWVLVKVLASVIFLIIINLLSIYGIIYVINCCWLWDVRGNMLDFII